MHRPSKRHLLEAAIRKNSVTSENQIVVDYLRLRLNNILTQWIAGVKLEEAERYRGEAACLRDLIQILSNTQVELIEGDTDDN